MLAYNLAFPKSRCLPLSDLTMLSFASKKRCNSALQAAAWSKAQQTDFFRDAWTAQHPFSKRTALQQHYCTVRGFRFVSGDLGQGKRDLLRLGGGSSYAAAPLAPPKLGQTKTLLSQALHDLRS